MNRSLLILPVFLVLNTITTITAIAGDFMEFGDVNFGRDYKEKSKWLLKSGAEMIRYQSSLPEFIGKHEEIEKGEENDLNGYGLSIGRDFYIGKGLSAMIAIGGYYSKTLDKVLGKAARDIDFDFSETRTAHQLTAYEASIAINYLFDYKIVDIQPFIETGAGAGQVLVEKQYSRKGFTQETNGSEKYDVTTEETFAFSRVSVGVNFISYKGFMSYFKLTAMQMLKTARETKGTTNAFGSAVTNDVSSKEDDLSESATVSMAAIGIGRFF